jgi:spore maturation protein CgeB
MDGRYYNIDYSNNDKKYNIIWMGSPTRKYVQELKRDIGLIQMMKAGQGYINTIAQAKVALNSRGSIDLNYKNYEITGLGTCLVTDYDDAFVELGFKDGVNCYFYRDYNECLYKIKLALTGDNYKVIGHNGFEFSKTQNYVERFKRLLKIMDENVLTR